MLGCFSLQAWGKKKLNLGGKGHVSPVSYGGPKGGFGENPRCWGFYPNSGFFPTFGFMGVKPLEKNQFDGINAPVLKGEKKRFRITL
ncbi:MAG: hypothetical protein CM15mP130_0950 [Verrucomicrobiota bacterium]|nr:MAG: hypothetical protein CM15mP130_0950 [Verrucomicrobiota bacterium]